jgi:peroxiredoxin
VKVQEALDQFRAHGIGVVGVGFSDADRLRDLRDELGLSFPLASGPAKRWYRAFQPRRARWRELLRPVHLITALRATRAGLRQRRADGDVRQLGADLLLQNDEVVKLWSSELLEDRPSATSVIAAADRASARPASAG